MRSSKRLSKQSLPKALMRTIEGISPVFAREAEFYTARGQELSVEDMTEEHFDRLAFYLKKDGNGY